ncbi:MAG TPA: Mur ligase family protein [Steroidobacteraceae bacterium]|jgi:UDP-N-acetylmuramyl pentapeptide synthase
MFKTDNSLLDWVRHGGGARTKALYRRPVIEAARLWRHLLARTCFIGVTGSAGKTTTKDLLHAALAMRFRAAKNWDSNNVLYPIARTLLTVGPRAQFCVQEVGANVPGAFDVTLPLLKPKVGVVTNVGTDHYTAFRGRIGVAAEKTKLIACLPAEGLAILNADDDLVAAMAATSRARVVTYGLREQAEFRGEIINDRWPERLTLRIHHGGDNVLVPTRLLGAHLAGNVLAAVATACSLGVPLAEAALAVSGHESVLGRMSVHETTRGVTFIRDDLKAPLWSLDKAWQFMAQAQAARKLIVLGTISDYPGAWSPRYRDATLSAMQAADHVLLIGRFALKTAAKLKAIAAGKLFAFETVREASTWLGEFARTGDLVLLKGSNNADHLARMALAMDQEVRCWRMRCGWEKFCDECRLIGDSAPP